MEKTTSSNKKEWQDIKVLLEDLDQLHITKVYDEKSEEEKQKLVEQINYLEDVYPGGLKEYNKRAKVLLNDSKNQVNPFSNYIPSVPEGVNLKIGSDSFLEYEKLGLALLQYTGFVLVAGGLGERLGYDDIKIGIPAELVTGRTYLEIYIDYIKAYEDRVKSNNQTLAEDWFIPLCIMTSDDTYKGTKKLLEDRKNFNLKENQITIIKQEKVPALINNDCHMALIEGQYVIETKPSGHGAVHTLLHNSKTISDWKTKGKKYVVFFQDTNALIFNVIPSALGVSEKDGLMVNSITVPRKPGEAVGAICKLTDQTNNKSITVNVEYNQLDSLLKAKYNPLGDVANNEGFSDFPGNINVLIFELNSYNQVLERTKGLMPEFVNPKYADETFTKFKSPTRLESMMQDYPRLLEGEKVGFTNYERWFSFSACKNNLKEGIEKVKKGLPAETAFSVEQDIYNCNVKILRDVLKKLEISENEPHKESVIINKDIKIEFEPKLLILPSFAIGLKELNDKIKDKIILSNNSTLILMGRNSRVGSLCLDGFLSASSLDLSGENMFMDKRRLIYVPLEEVSDKNQIKSYESIRGYVLSMRSGSTSTCKCAGH